MTRSVRRFETQTVVFLQFLSSPSARTIFPHLMKTQIKFVSLAIISIQVCCADVTSKLIGKWSGTATATSNGAAISQKISTVYKRYEGTGLSAVTTIQVSGQRLIGTSRYHKNGKVEGDLKRNGSTVAVISGTWSATSKVLTANVKAEGLFPTFRSNSRSMLVAPGKLSISGTTSTGERSVGSLTLR